MPKHEETDQGAARLAELGFDPNAPAEQALEQLRRLRGRPGVTDAAIARALGNILSQGAAEMLAAMEGHGADRREIRRALFRLRQRGFIPAPTAPAAPAPAIAAPAEAGLSAMLSPIDPEGARIVWIIKSRRQGGLTRLWGLTSESEGLVGATLANLSRRDLREQRAELERLAGAKLVEADWRLADFILCEAYRRTPEARRSQVGNFLTLRAELTASAVPLEFEHPVYRELGAECAAEPSVELLKEPEIAGWKLAPELIKPYLDEVNEIRQSPLVLARLQQEDRINAVAERAIAELLSGERGACIRRRLEDTAYYLARTGRKAAAGWAAAAAARIRDGAELRRVAFFQTFVRSQLGAMLKKEEEREREEPRLIMTPAEAMRAAQQRGRAR